jgi:hypothetical protein
MCAKLTNLGLYLGLCRFWVCFLPFLKVYSMLLQYEHTDRKVSSRSIWWWCVQDSKHPRTCARTNDVNLNFFMFAFFLTMVIIGFASMHRFSVCCQIEFWFSTSWVTTLYICCKHQTHASFHSSMSAAVFQNPVLIKFLFLSCFCFCIQFVQN